MLLCECTSKSARVAPERFYDGNPLRLVSFVVTRVGSHSSVVSPHYQMSVLSTANLKMGEPECSETRY